MTPRPIIIDCDPGQDDAVNLLLALSSPEALDLLAVATVAGNVPLERTQQNARIICELAGRPGVPVFAGCSAPLKRPLITAEKVHGRTGIDGIAVYEPATPIQDLHAVDFLVDTLMAADPHSITLVPTGPLTNIAAAIQGEPAILNGVREIVMMGGAMREGGNFSPSAEFNILVDPDAAEVVLGCGRPMTVMGLDVTHQVLSTPDRIACIRALNNPVAEATADMLAYFHRFDTEKYGSEGSPLHDPCTVAYLLQPALFQGRACNVSVETASPLTLGHTAVDFWHVTDRPENVNWIHSVDADGFYELLTGRLARFGR